MFIGPNPAEQLIFTALWYEVLQHATISRRTLRKLEACQNSVSRRTAHLIPSILQRLRYLRRATVMAHRDYGMSARYRYDLAGFLFERDRRELEQALSA